MHYYYYIFLLFIIIMFKLFVISILIINSIFWGFYPVSDISPHQRMLNYLKLNIKASFITHCISGLFFYILAILISHSIIY
jgi:hypothetical protein